MKPVRFVGSARQDLSAFPGAARVRAGHFRVIYVASFSTAVYVLHAFEKKSRNTSGADLKLARRRYRKAKTIENEG